MRSSSKFSRVASTLSGVYVVTCIAASSVTSVTLLSNTSYTVTAVMEMYVSLSPVARFTNLLMLLRSSLPKYTTGSGVSSSIGTLTFVSVYEVFPPWALISVTCVTFSVMALTVSSKWRTSSSLVKSKSNDVSTAGEVSGM